MRYKGNGEESRSRMEEGGRDRGTSPGSVLQKRRVDGGTRKMYIAHHATSYENILDRGL